MLADRRYIFTFYFRKWTSRVRQEHVEKMVKALTEIHFYVNQFKRQVQHSISRRSKRIRCRKFDSILCLTKSNHVSVLFSFLSKRRLFVVDIQIALAFNGRKEFIIRGFVLLAMKLLVTTSTDIEFQLNDRRQLKTCNRSEVEANDDLWPLAISVAS